MKNKKIKFGWKEVLIILLISMAIIGLLLWADLSKKNGSITHIEKITAQAIEEGSLESLAMPDSWANWGETWTDLNMLYGIDHTDTDMGSAEELECFAQGIGDIGDVGYEYAAQAEAANLTMKYKTSYWEDIPDWAKDDDGDWTVCYTGTLAFLINKDIVAEVPYSWQDLLEGDYLVGINDPVNASLDQYAVYSAAIAMGGSINDLEPGIQFFKTLAEQGRLVTDLETLDDFLDSGVGVQIKWDYIALGYRDTALAMEQPVNLTACIPQDGSVTVGYASIINKDAKNPNAAMAAREYILSDAGQLNLARGYATPIRSIKLPDEMEQTRIPREQYKETMTERALLYNAKTAKTIADTWETEVKPVLGGGTQ